ncbi:NAD-dependent epimerase/dehydratase family protein [Streptomyces sp. GMR22]|uniref:NAD-dependent epimerase/dehydratase family protein n=1 Tax=Streptomyces sp. GMR22 TaxID=2759524 RepID=UPI0015F8EE18|nr:NAD(P)-dependent oxidoreductase [Streptomyces sp. GMR22]MBA6434667.1 NAD(P)-dependent oxidoreductase [Streptomyces sp. GMR22]
MTARVLVAGATGVIGRALVPLLSARGHHVTALVREPSGAASLSPDGVVVADALDAEAVRAAVLSARPEVVVHQLTALRGPTAEGLEHTARLRTEGTAHLIAAAEAAGARRMVAQSIAFATAPDGGPVLTEDAPLHVDAPDPGWALTARAIAELERRVLGAAHLSGTVLRYGTLYGPGTLYHHGGAIHDAVARGRLPLPDPATGVTSFLHVEDAARAAVRAVEADTDGVFNVADDDPAEAAVWLPEYARLLGAPPPRTVPAPLAERMLGWLTAHQLTAMRGASNDRIRQALDWKPSIPSWRTRLAAD